MNMFLMAAAALSAFGISWVIGVAIADPSWLTTVKVATGLVMGNVAGILMAKGVIPWR